MRSETKDGVILRAWRAEYRQETQEMLVILFYLAAFFAVVAWPAGLLCFVGGNS